MSQPPFDIQPTLRGEKILLRPLREEDFEMLYGVASDPAIWAMHPYRDRYRRDVFKSFFSEAIASKGAFAIIDRADRSMIGSTRFANYDPRGNEIEIGWTFFATAYWRNGTNREVKSLMLSHIFAHVRTVVFQIGAENQRSRIAVERLGGRLTREYLLEHNDSTHNYVRYELTADDAAQGALALVLA